MKKLIILESIIIIILLSAIIFISHSENKSANIPVYSETILNNKLNTKNILILGNSITRHGICEYWWGNWGMAATSRDNDYVHVLMKKISTNSNINFDIVSFYAWEANSHDRSEFLDLLQPILKKNYDYIIIQLGENISNQTTTLEKDFESLINYIMANSKAQIIVIGNFWEKEIIDKIKINICKKYNIKFIDLKDIQNENYYSGIDTFVLGDDNRQHKIQHQGVATHPNDKAMKYIADKIFDSMN